LLEVAITEKMKENNRNLLTKAILNKELGFNLKFDREDTNYFVWGNIFKDVNFITS